jgi:hypothetical protein
MFMNTGLFMTREKFLVCSLSVKVSARMESQIEDHLVEDHIISPTVGLANSSTNE